MKEPLKKAKYHKNKGIEITENGVLMQLLGEAVSLQITGGNDDFPNIDGYIHLLEEDRSMSGQFLQIQIKPLLSSKKGVFSTCGPSLLAHSRDTNSPVLLIGVDIKDSTAYWRYLSPEFVDAYVEETPSIPKETITLYFEKKNKIDPAPATAHLKGWKKVCNHHRNESNDKIITRYIKHLWEGANIGLTSERLNTLQNLAFYRTTDGKYPLADLIFNLAEEVQKGDVHLKATYIDALKQLAYHKTKSVVNILFSFLDDEVTIKESVKKIILDISKYNLHIIKNIGYHPQRVLLDSVPKILYSEEDVQKLGLEIIENILEPSFEGTSNTTLNTLTFHHGPLPLNPFLKKLRKEAMDLLIETTEQGKNLAIRLKALKALSRAFHTPDWSFGSPEEESAFLSMLDKDAKYIVDKYKKLALNDKGQPIDLFPLVYEVERQLARLKVWKRGNPDAEKLLETLRKPTTNYSFYKMFAGDELDLCLEEGYDVVEKRKAESIAGILDSISDKNIEVWLNRFEEIASFKHHTDDWRLHTFRDFLARLSIQKPKFADKLLAKIFAKKGALYPFGGSLIFGLRKNSLALWDKYVTKIQKDQSQELTIQLLQSFEIKDRVDIKIREQDAALIKNIAEGTGEFSFLDKQNIQLRYQTMRCLTYVSVTNPKLFKEMILKQIQLCSALNGMFFDQLGTGIHWKWIELSDWSKDELKQLTDFLIRASDLDYNHEQVLHEIGKNDFDIMMSVFDKRLTREAKQSASRYTAIPYRFTTEVTTFIANHPRYPHALKAWISKVNDRRDLYAMDLGRLVYEIGGTALRQSLEELIKTGKDANLKKVLSLFPLIETPDFELCFKIVDATDNEDIWSRVGGGMRSTGVMSGSYGENLYGNALRNLKEKFELELQHTMSQRVKKFCEKEIGHLEIDIKQSDEEHKRKLQQEQEEFDASKDEE